MKDSPKIIVVVGQTSTGKSDFAVEVAKIINGEIISADSRQVYKGMDIGTGKITKKEMRGIPHHLLSLASPRTVFTVSKFKKLADKKIKEIIARGNVPIICGGTGFYIDAVVNNTVLPEVPPNAKLRAELYQLDAIALTRYLEKLDPERVKTIDTKNKVRLIRAIEIAIALGSVPSLASDGTNPKHDVLKIGLTLPDEILKERIYKRILIRIKKHMFKEFEKLHKNGLSLKKMQSLGLEYKYGAMYIKKEIDKEQFIEKLNTDTWHYAKRQKTWFKRDIKTIWLDQRNKKEVKNIERKIKLFLQ